jgi:hypothetical protein
MTNTEKLKAIADNLAEKKQKQDAVKAKYKGKKLTDKERIDRIEELLGIIDK